jgi:hypothetical protein
MHMGTFILKDETQEGEGHSHFTETPKKRMTHLVVPSIPVLFSIGLR